MKIAITGPQDAIKELTGNISNVDWIEVNGIEEFCNHKDSVAFFNLYDDASQVLYPAQVRNIFINSVITPISELKEQKNLTRINGWTGFLKRTTWEISTNTPEEAESILHHLGKKIILVKDEPGLISARVISMIINEAYFAKQEAVSTETEIDIAMKLGTNYPNGPFAWAKEIGKEKILALLDKLASTENRYTPAALLRHEASL